MKKLTFSTTLFVLLLLKYPAYTQIYAPEVKVQQTNNNQVLIGAETTAQATLHVNGSGSDVVKIESSDASSQILMENTSVGGNLWRLICTGGAASIGGGKFSIYSQQNGVHDFVIDNSGRVGIGTASNTLSSQLTSHSATWQLGINNSSGNNPWYFGASDDNWFSGNDKLVITSTGSSSNPQLTITKTGQIGIGTNSPASGYKLHVDGDIKVKRITTTSRTNWSDFVFANNYQLSSLSSVEKYIQKYKHLPDIPSEAEVSQNGYELGDMDAKLLQKIEELTLYLIDQEKHLKEVESTNQQLLQRINHLTTTH